MADRCAKCGCVDLVHWAVGSEIRTLGCRHCDAIAVPISAVDLSLLGVRRFPASRVPTAFSLPGSALGLVSSHRFGRSELPLVVALGSSESPAG